MNFSKDNQPVDFDENKGLKQVFNSADQKWDGPGVVNSLQPQSIIIYTN